MARKKVKLAWIADDSARRATFKKRSKGLLKKVRELSTLCGVDTCAIVYGPYDPNPEVWPSLPEAHDVLSRFKNMPDIEKSKKMMNQEGFLRQRVTKTKQQCKKLQMENCLNQMELMMNQSLRGKGLQRMLSKDSGDLSLLIEEKSRHIHDPMEYLKMRITSTPPMLHASNERVPMQMQMQMQPIQMQRPMAMQIQMQMPTHMHMPMGVGKVEGSEVKRSVEHLDFLEAMQRYPSLMDIINHSRGGGYFAGDYVERPYGETAAWPNTCFPR